MSAIRRKISIENCYCIYKMVSAIERCPLLKISAIERFHCIFDFRYGDVAPRSLLGRMVTIVWMVIGILIAAMITSTMTDAVGSTDYLDIYKSHVRI